MHIQRKDWGEFLTYLFRLCFNQWNASFILAQVSIHFFQKACFSAAMVGTFMGIPLQIFYPPSTCYGGYPMLVSGCWLGHSACVQTCSFVQIAYFCQTIFFAFPDCMISLAVGSRSVISLAVGSRSDGNRVVLARHFITLSRVSSPSWQAIFLSCGANRSCRKLIFQFALPRGWISLQRTTGRVYIFFEFSSVTAVATPRLESGHQPASPDGSDVESSEEDER